MKKYMVLGLAIILSVPLLASAHGHFQRDNGHNNKHVPTKSPTPAPTPVPPVQPPTPPQPPSTPVAPVGGETRFIAYTTGYGYPDNTPAGNAISNPIIHSGAGGTGTYADPITLAVGHSITNKNDTLDYPAGTRFYIPNLRKYFIVEDTCGDGNTPQNGPCHTGFDGHIWLDLWVGGTVSTKSATLACEDTITDLHEVIENPVSTYAVVTGPVFSGTCATQYGDTVVSQ